MAYSLGRSRCVLWFGLTLLPGLAWGQPQFEGKQIVSIQYDPAPAPLAQKDLDRLQVVKTGTPLRMADIGTTIDRLYASGRFEDIQVDAEPSGPDGVAIRFLTKPAWFVGHVGVTGKIILPPNRGQVVNTSQLSLGTPFHDADLHTAEENIKKLFDGNGLYDANVQSHVDRDPRTQTVHVTFAVKPGKRAKYAMPVIKGDPKLSEATILRATGWRIPLVHWWRQVTQARTTGGLDALNKKYQKQERLTAKVTLDSLEYDASRRRVKPSLTLNAGPKVRVRAVEAKVSKGRLKKYVPVYDEGTVDRDLLVEGARNLRDYFQSQGYYDASVDFRPVQQKQDELLIEYVIARGARSKLANVTLQGNKYFVADALRERMFLEPNSLQYRHGRYSEAFRKKDEESVSNLYRANGFRDVKVTSSVQNDYKGKPGQIGVIFTVEEGPQWFVDDLKIDGVSNLDLPTLQSKLSAVKGQPFSEVSIAADRNTILTEYYSGGFPNAAFEYKVDPSGQPNHVNLTYSVTEGAQQFVREVLVSGLTNTRKAIVDKQMTLHSGDRLSPTGMTNAQKKLYDLGIFAKVDTAVQNPEGETQYRNVLYDFEEAHRYTLNLGFGAEIAQFGGTTTNLNSPGGATGFSPRASVDVSRLNFLGTGHTVSVRSRVSDLEQRVAFEYLAPRFQNVEGRNITFTVLYDKARDVRTFSSTRQEASIQVSQRFSKATTGLFRFTYRRVSTTDVIIPALLVPQLLQPIRIGILSANLVQDRRDDPTDARRGIYNTMDIGLASSIFGSQRNFVRGLGRNATYTKIGKKYVLARQTQLGLILPYNPPKGLDAAESIPLPERFFGGGANSHRGFPYNQAGPRDIGTPAGPGGTATQPTGFPLGGNALLFNTVELRFPLIGANIGGVLFHDAGNVYRSLSDISFRASQKNMQDFNYMVHAAGFGIRYRTPIGPVRIDLAYSINPPAYVGFKGTQLELLSCNPNLPPSQLPPVCQGVRQSIGHFQFSFSIGQAF